MLRPRKPRATFRVMTPSPPQGTNGSNPHEPLRSLAMKSRTILAALTAVTLAAAPLTALAQTATPPTPKPAAGALPQPNPNAVQKSFRTQNAAEQQSSSQTTPMEIGQSGRSRSPN